MHKVSLCQCQSQLMNANQKLSFLSSSARRQGSLKPGKPSMVLGSSWASEGKGPTSAYKRHGWGPKPPWYARCVTIMKAVAAPPTVRTLECDSVCLLVSVCHGLGEYTPVPPTFALTRHQLLLLSTDHLTDLRILIASFTFALPHQLSMPHFCLINTMLHAYTHPLFCAFKQAYSHTMQPGVSNQ